MKVKDIVEKFDFDKSNLIIEIEFAKIKVVKNTSPILNLLAEYNVYALSVNCSGLLIAVSMQSF